jgi:hypothetical protein
MVRSRIPVIFDAVGMLTTSLGIEGRTSFRYFLCIWRISTFGFVAKATTRPSVEDAEEAGYILDGHSCIFLAEGALGSRLPEFDSALEEHVAPWRHHTTS